MIFCSTLHTQVTADEIRFCTLVGHSDSSFAVEADPGKRVEVCRSYRLVAWSGHLRLFSHHYFGGARYISGSILATAYKPQVVSSVERSCCVSWWAVICCPRCAIFEVGVVLFGGRVAAAWNVASLRGFSLSF